ncbi:alpha/beta fold hydrolase [Ornithinimicrobium cryptoxanthini]|uniref:Alpha/beta hydrolase n=1 Tax=Ornithinimicrobium cryptoxanthini TaxID=2934161 RepID=A0ABY4YGR5_9MICO|nr:alpha/beta hydrolase [Ornithinimicrobium cryptoxanthini]USQ75726.1 alpha/beta hydrolase [Ornithinimicrobium cryptoxanthini]
MSRPERSRSPVSLGAGIGAGLAAAGLAAVGAVTVDRLWRDRRHAIALGTEDDFTVAPSEVAVVVADDGVPLHVEIDEPEGWDGSRPTVILSHGFTLDLRCWVFQRRALLEAGHRVVTWDLRGHGTSGEGAEESYNIEQLGVDLARVIQQVAPTGDLVLAGHSMGGMTVMALAEADPGLFRDRVVAVALISTSAGGLHRITWGVGSMLGRVVNKFGPTALTQLSPHQDLLDSVLRGGKELQEFFVARGSFGSPVPLSLVRLTADMIFGTPLTVISAFTHTLEDHDKREALANMGGQEVLVFNGDKDVLTSAVHSTEIVDAIPGAEHVFVRDAGHIIMLEHPELLNQELFDLLTRADRSRGQTPREAGSRHTVTDLTKRRRDRMTRPARGRTRARA